jgi:tRNA dimethylallyltransferase
MRVDAVLIAGPTASGKSAVALSLAERFAGAVVNADSMQVYRELRILTARPSPADEAKLPHRLYGHVSVAERYSAGRYQREAAQVLEELTAGAKARLPIFAGGTGLYFDALERGLSPIPTVSPEIREQVRARFEEIGREAFYAELCARDPSCAVLRISDTQRILRAADVLEATGLPLSHWQRLPGEPVLQNRKLARFVIAPPRAALYARIDARFHRMMEEGALEEVRALADLDPALPAARALGVPSLLAYMEGAVSYEAAVEEAARRTRNYAKRQMAWLRTHMADWVWIEEEGLRNILSIVQENCS